MSLIDNIRPCVPPGEQLEYAFTGQTGVNPNVRWIPYARFALLGNKPRIIAVTEQRVMVFAAARYSRHKPKALLYSLPRDTAWPHGTGRWSRVPLGSEQVWIGFGVYPMLDQLTSAGGGGQPAAGWFPDPSGTGTLRWWDGSTWTQHTHAG